MGLKLVDMVLQNSAGAVSFVLIFPLSFQGINQDIGRHTDFDFFEKYETR